MSVNPTLHDTFTHSVDPLVSGTLTMSSFKQASKQAINLSVNLGIIHLVSFVNPPIIINLSIDTIKLYMILAHSVRNENEGNVNQL